MKNFPKTTVITIINTSIVSAFNYIVPIDLAHIFKRYKNLPAIVRTNETEKWYKPGLSRTVFFEDGSTSKETLLTVVPYKSFSYKIESFTSSLRFLAKWIEGRWLFKESDKGEVKIEWTYVVIPKNIISQIIVEKFLIKSITGLLENAMKIIKNDLESNINI